MFKALKKNLKIVKYVFMFCPKLVCFSIFYIIANVVTTLSKVYIIKLAVDMVVNKSSIVNIILMLVLYIVIIVLTTLVKSFYDGYVAPKYRLVYVNKMQNLMYKKVKNIDYADFDNPEFYDSYSRALRDGSARGIRVFEDFTNLVSSFVCTIALGAFIIISDIYLIFIVLITSIVAVIINIKNNSLWYKLSKDTEKYRRMYHYVNRTFYQQRYAAEVKTTPISELLIERYDDACQGMNKEYIKMQKKITGFSAINSFVNNIIGMGAEYIYLGYRLFFKNLGVATFTSTLSAAQQFTRNFSDMAEFIVRIKLNALYIDDFLWLMNYKPSLETKGEKVISKKLSILNMDSLTFKYPVNEKNTINNLSLKITKGERLAIVGLNGAGKTTLIKLLLKFYNPDSGDIYFNSDRIRDIKEDDIRSKYSIVFQDFRIYATTIGENILMRKLEGEEDEKRVWDALEKVGLKDKILKMKDGINTLVTREFERDGVEFSGGERQKLVIARVFASNREVYILDEPTSNLDPFAEHEINKLIIDNAEGKTIIIIAHRLSTVVDADKIILIENGEIVESGNHEELLKQDGKYKEMFASQASLYQKNQI